jgi:hypothetical protein
LTSSSIVHALSVNPTPCAGVVPRVLYVGESHTGNLAKTLKRHFYPWRDDAERVHNTYDRHAVEVAVRLTPPPAAVGAQDNLIRRLEPRDNGYTPVEKPF